MNLMIFEFDGDFEWGEDLLDAVGDLWSDSVSWEEDYFLCSGGEVCSIEERGYSGNHDVDNK